MGVDATLRLHWTQRIALVRHNLRAARRTNDFTFFKTLQAHAIIDGTDHVAILHSLLGDDADSVLLTLDNLNAGVAYVHQDAFIAVYDSTKSAIRRSLLPVDVCQQRDMSDHAMDKTANSAVQLIHAKPAHCREAVANACVTGTTIIADAVCVCLNEMEATENNLDDFIRLEYSWNSIQNSVDAAISALRGIFTFGGLIKRAFSTNHGMGPPPLGAHRSGRASSLSIPDANPRGLRLSVSAACPTKMPMYTDHPHTLLTTIPPTPSVHGTPGTGTASPFRTKGDYFAFDTEKEAEKAGKEGASPSPSDLIESLDPLYSPTAADLVKIPVLLILRRLSDAFSMSPPPVVGA
ncbi:hypothetical protein BU23DRAFT_586367 [Bimuria novae-zelandiae CBS 107.79]|uniref:Uncharacterized protein n=1 Tax=Bimuria novae-zelandiae CBS 107.79 TaxID=1447943 RepID=A0A6A5VR58_9PLEO|nr:hypothetical protein BU23DRAFT_586367 [Bimuria novae-zelandiae CBS 107.79]